ncbi:MAG: carbonic anhydrase family protein [Bacteroidales bacterium]|nr:carbonic anhydrase family protein [Bacteroidales bacterium]
MKRLTKIFIPILAVVIMASCGNSRVSERTHVLTQAEQQALTPDCVIEILRKGNQQFVNGELTVRNNPALIADGANGQFPMAVILSCLDSRVPVEDVFNRYIGDLFVGRVAGNFVNVDLLGSMEFACAAAGARLIMVLGHDACGAVVHAINRTELGNITEMLSSLQPAVAATRATFRGEQSTDNKEFVDAVAIQNVKMNVQRIRNESPILAEMERNGEIRIIGGYYRLATGEVEFFTNI